MMTPAQTIKHKINHHPLTREQQLVEYATINGRPAQLPILLKRQAIRWNNWLVAEIDND